MTLVIDASVVASAFVEEGEEGVWARGVLVSDDLEAPHLMLAEAVSILRRWMLRGIVSDIVASLMHSDMQEMRVGLHGYEPYAARIWDLRHNVTSYDAWYVALAESLDAPLATLDRRLAQAVGPRCRFVTPS